MGDTSRDTQGWGGGGILAVVTQSDLSRRLRIMAGGGGVTQYAPVAMGDTSRDTRGGGGGILAVVTQSDLSRSHVSWRAGGGGGGGGIIKGGGGYVICSGGHG